MLIILKIRLIILLISPFFIVNGIDSKKIIVSFYNVENLFDTYDSDKTNDSEFTPNGKKNYTLNIYKDRIKNISFVISEIGNEYSSNGPNIIGLAEIENRNVLEDLIKHPNIINNNYSVVHYDSPDNRGIDVALLYQSNNFDFQESKKFKVKLIDDDGKQINTRDILLVSGKIQGEMTHLIVNHWPSRYGGKLKSEKFRKKSALTVNTIIDSILYINPNHHIIIMGDFNDDPSDKSVAQISSAFKSNSILNLYIDIHKKGIGTSNYKGNWNLFDQILVSKSLIKSRKSKNLVLGNVGIFNEPYLFQQRGKYKGYPFRAYGGNNYLGGYSDHFPIYIILESK